MDISEYLAATQTDPSSRMLARNTHMAIPDADNDPRTQDAASAHSLVEQEQNNAPQQEEPASGQGTYDPAMEQPQYIDQSQGEDQSQSFAEGGDPGDEEAYEDTSGQELERADSSGDKRIPNDKWENLPDSKNIEDRRGEGNANQDQMSAHTTHQYNTRRGTEPGQSGALIGQGPAPETSARKAWGNVADKLGSVASWRFAEGGDPEEAAAAEVEQPQAGAIPEPQGEEYGPQESAGPPQPQERPGFRETLGNAMGMRGREAQQQTQTAGEEGWRNSAQEAVSAGLDFGRNAHRLNGAGVQDGSEDPHGYLSGKGATPGDQFMAAQQAVDPDGAMDPASRLQKTLGSIYDFYKGKYGADSETPDTPAAKAAHGALQFLRKAYDAYSNHAIVAVDKGAPEVAAKSAEQALNKVPDGLLAHVMYMGPRALASGGASIPGDLANIGRANATPAGSPGTSQAAAPPAQTAEPGAEPRPETTGNKFRVSLTDPESGKTVLNSDLTAAQLQDMLHKGFDRHASLGTPNLVQQSAQTPPGQEGHPKKTWGQQLAEANGLPGMDVGGLSNNTINQLRMKYLNTQAGRGGAEDPSAVRERMNKATLESQERRNAQTNQQRDQSNTRTNETKVTTAGMPARPTAAPGQTEATRRSHEAEAAKETRDWARNQQRATQEQTDQFHNQRRALRGLPPLGAQPQQGAPAAAPAQQPQGSQTKEYNGRTYVYDPVKKGWIAQ